MMTMRDLRVELAGQGIELWTARMKTRVRETIGRIDDLEFGPVYPTVRAALAAFEAREEAVEHEGASSEQPATHDGVAPTRD